MKPLTLSGLLALVLAGIASAESQTLIITVAAVPHERTNVPVEVPLTLPDSLAKAASVLLEAKGGKPITAQLTRPGLLAVFPKAADGSVQRELHFILPHLQAGETITLQAVISTDPPAPNEHFSWADYPGNQTDLWYGNRLVLSYMYKALDDSTKENREKTYKVFHHLYDPTGQRLVTKGPGGQDTHHRGLFYGFNRISYGDNKKADVWQCTGDCYQSHEHFLDSEAGPVLGRHRVEIAWHGPGKEIFAREEREVTVYNIPGGTLVEFASRLRSADGKVKLDGDPQHAGFHFRADNEVAAKTSAQTYFLRPDGPGQPGEARNWDPKTRTGPTNLPWNCMSFVLGGKRYTVAYLDKPSNPKEARYSERAYGRFGSYFEYDLEEKHPLDIDYRIWLQQGEMTVAEAAELDTDFVQPGVASVK